MHTCRFDIKGLDKRSNEDEPGIKAASQLGKISHKLTSSVYCYYLTPSYKKQTFKPYLYSLCD